MPKIPKAKLPKGPSGEYFGKDKFLKGFSRPGLLGTGIAIGGVGTGATGYLATRRRQELSAKLDALIEFQAFGAIQNIFGKLGRYGETGASALQKGYGAAAGAAKAGYAAAAPAVQRGASAAAGAAQRGYAAAAPAIQRGAGALGRGITAADTAIGRGRELLGKAAGTAVGAVGRGALAVGGATAAGAAGAAEAGYGALKNVVGKIGAARQARQATEAAGKRTTGIVQSYMGGFNAPASENIAGLKSPFRKFTGTPEAPAIQVPAAGGGGVIRGNSGFHDVTGGVGAAPSVSQIPGYQAGATRAAGSVPAAAAPGTQAQAAQATAQAAGQQAGQAAAAAPAAPATAVKKVAGKKAVKKPGKKTAAEPQGGWWSRQSKTKKWAIGAGAGLGAGIAGASYLGNGGNQQMSAKIKDVKIFESAEEPIWFDNRPRDQMGQFEQQGEGGPDPNKMAAVYKHPGVVGALARGGALAIGGGALGQVGGEIGKQLLDKAKQKAKTIRK